MNSRISWADLPGSVRAALEDIVGGPVVSAVSQAGGYSPGTADRGAPGNAASPWCMRTMATFR